MNIHPIKIALFSLLVAFFTQNAFSMTVGEAKAKGLAGEQANGYVAIVTPHPTTALKALVTNVNNKRREIYIKLAQKQHLTLEDIEKIAGERNINKTPSGQFVKYASGDWVTKK